MNIARSSLKLFGANLFSSILGFVGIMFFARSLGATPLGVFFLFEALLGILTIPADFGLRGAVEKRISEGESEGAFLSGAIVLKTIPITVIILAIALLHPFINEYLGANIAVFLAVALLLREGANLSVSVLNGELRVGETAILQLAYQVIWVGCGALFVVWGYGAKGIVYALLLGTSVKLVWGWSKSSIPLQWPSIEHVRSLFDYGKYNFISSIGGYFYGWMDVAIIGLFLTQAHVGAYEVAWRVTAVVMLLSKSIATTLFPQVSRWDAEDAESRIESTIQEAIGPSMVLIIPAFFGTLLLSHDILGLVFGSEFTIAGLALIILMGEKVFQSVHVILGRSLQAIDRPNLAARAGIVAMAVNLLLNVPLVFYYGIVGAAAATAVSFIANTLLHAYYVDQFLTISPPYEEIGGSVLASVGMVIILYALKTVAAIQTLPHLLIFVSIGVFLYVIFSIVIPSQRNLATTHLRQIIE